MCMEDVRIGQNTPVDELSKTVTTASTQLVDRNERRTLLIIYPPPSGTLTVSILTPVVANVGVTLQTTSPPLIMSIQTHGQLLYKAWYAIHSAGGVQCTFHEGVLDPEKV